ncbi:membrane dipeptidase [Streptomyces sp. 3213.3]|uniref:membrane dipeptidase n=1 Tax=Streptomyces sp. 3213.3 TaxID=1855348 RepID=UPI001F35A84B|nr:membrane dipeptidase [Streptomyces sp. 3213.3]
MSNGIRGSAPPALLREQRCCLPFERYADVGELARYRRPGGSFVSVNVGYAPHGADDVTGLVAGWRERIEADERLRLVATVGDIDDAVRAGEVAVAFDLEDSGPLEGDLDRSGTSTTSVCAPCCRATTPATRPAAASTRSTRDSPATGGRWYGS